MSYNINLGDWKSVFAVPSSVVDKHLKIASGNELKVLLYILKNSSADNTQSGIASDLSINENEVKNAVDFWIERGLLTDTDAVLSPHFDTVKDFKENDDNSSREEQKSISKKALPVNRVVRPNAVFVAQKLKSDKNLAALLDDAQIALSKTLSPGDISTLVMLNDTYGLPCRVIALLINYSVSIGKSNMHAIEKIGISWSEKDVFTIELAEKEIKRMSLSNNAWAHVSRVFGIHNVGNPTKSQLQFADTWINVWNFSDEMLQEAYERCVNTKGEYNIRYINAILSKWNKADIKSLEVLRNAEMTTKKPVVKKNSKPSVYSSEGASYDLASYEKKVFLMIRRFYVVFTKEH